MMNIFEYYIERNKDIKWVNLYKSTSNKNNGKTFIYINTNYRTVFAFINIFQKFYDYNGLQRKDWKLNENHGQEEAKQWVVNMTHSKLFKRDKNIFTLTAKGMAFKEFIESEFNERTKWLLLFLFLNNSYFSLVPNYINKTCSSVFDILINIGYTKEEILSKIEEVLLRKNITLEELFFTDIFWILTFYKDLDFLTLYQKASEQEKQQLYNYVLDNYTHRRYADCISYKFKPSGQYTRNTFVDDLKTLYMSMNISDSKPKSFNEYICNAFERYKKIYDFEEEQVEKFIYNHSDVFEIIFKETYGNIEEDITNEYEYIPRNGEKVIFESKLDDTTAKNQNKIMKMSSVLKRMSKERNDYKCELDDLNDCKYFTSKESNKNYLEVHHLVPREFSNEFEKSIEIIDNYVALCPHCHRMVHLATDRERIYALNYLFKKRRDALEKKDIVLTIKELKAFYGIEE